MQGGGRTQMGAFKVAGGGGRLRGRAGGRLKLHEKEEGSSFEVEQVSPPAAASSTFHFKAFLFPQVLDPGSKVV